MAQVPTILIKNTDPEAYNLGTVTQNPRTCTAIDVRSACANLDFQSQNGESALVQAFVRYLFTKYFVLAHQSGLYNRQMRLWESFSKVEKVEFKQISGGLFTKSYEPAYELAFRNGANHVLLMALLLEHSLSLMPQKAREDKELNLIKDFAARVAKVQVRQGGGALRGIFIASPTPAEPTRNYLIKETGGDDPVARFDCYMGSPLQVHVNYLGYSQIESEAEPAPEAVEESEPALVVHNPALDFAPVRVDDFAFELVYPSLPRR